MKIELEKYDEEQITSLGYMLNNIDLQPMQHEVVYMNFKTMQKLLAYQIFDKPSGEVYLFGKLVKSDMTLKDDEIVFGKTYKIK